MGRRANLLYVAFSLAFLALLPFRPVPLAWAIKVLPIAVLALAVASRTRSAGRLTLALALVFCAAGDVLLELGSMVPGIAAFLVAQVHYATFFGRRFGSLRRRWPLSVGLVAALSTMAALLTPHLGELRVPVLTYLAVIAVMGLTAVHSKLPLRWAVLGALLFMVSDSLIAVDLFLTSVPLHDYWVMATYYVAQWMLIVGGLAALASQGAGQGFHARPIAEASPRTGA